VAGCATSTGSAGHAGATTNLKLTFHLDHSVGADHPPPPGDRVTVTSLNQCQTPATPLQRSAAVLSRASERTNASATKGQTMEIGPILRQQPLRIFSLKIRGYKYAHRIALILTQRKAALKTRPSAFDQNQRQNRHWLNDRACLAASA